jgi:hypothetical protein
MLRTQLSIGGLAVAVLLTLACGRMPIDQSAGASAKQASDDVRAAGFTSAGLGWTLSNGALKISSDTGNSWRSLQLPSAYQPWKAAVVVSDQMALIAGLNAKGALVGVTTSAGGNWSVAPLITSIPGVSGDVALASDGKLDAALVRFATSSNFAAGEVFSSVDGTAWTRYKAPTAGKIAITDKNVIWLAGGPINDQLWQSRDFGATWTRVTLPSLGGRYTIDTPHAAGSGALILPVTLISSAGTADEIFLRSSDGLAWQSVGRVRTTALIGPGVRLPTAIAGNRLYVANPNGTRTYIMKPSGLVLEVVSDGLPNGVSDIAFDARGNGWATVTNAQCLADKRTCSSLEAILRTLDGGSSWQRLGL